MTKEEVIEILKKFVIGAKPCSQKEIVDACTSAYRMLKEQPSLPSNLDEVAENRVTENGRFAITSFEKARIEDVIFGAKWMAGQGYTKEGVAHPDDCEIWVNMTDTDIKDGDKVIVQIRKK